MTLKELRGLLERAHPGPYEVGELVRPKSWRSAYYEIQNATDIFGHVYIGGDKPAKAEATTALLAAAVNALPDLLTLADRALSAEANVSAWKDEIFQYHGRMEAAEAERDAAVAREQALREALKPFADAASDWFEMGDTRPIYADNSFTVGDLRRARAALAQGEKDG